MVSNDYHFITHWRVKASLDEVTAIISDAESLPCWWPSVYLAVRQLEPGDAHGIGRRIALYTKGWLPYTLRWEFVVTESRLPHGLRLEAQGDFVGRGIWSFTADGEWVDITYDWQIQAEKPLLKRLSPLLKPIFAANHHWAMRQGEASLHIELLRRRASDAQARAAIPAPPPPTPSSPLAWMSYVLGLSRQLVS